MLPSSTSVVPLTMMNGRNIILEKNVLRNNTGITALPLRACFFNES
jgi:hypothetical protein